MDVLIPFYAICFSKSWIHFFNSIENKFFGCLHLQTWLTVSRTDEKKESSNWRHFSSSLSPLIKILNRKEDTHQTTKDKLGNLKSHECTNNKEERKEGKKEEEEKKKILKVLNKQFDLKPVEILFGRKIGQKSDSKKNLINSWKTSKIYVKQGEGVREDMSMVASPPATKNG